MNEPELSVRRRVAWAAGAFAAALLLTALIVFPNPIAVAFLPFFPEGLFFFVYVKGSIVALLLGWATYLALVLFLLMTGTARKSVFVFVVLCACLAVNVGGCKYIADNMRLPHSI